VANRQFDQYGLTIQKRWVTLWAEVAVPTGTAPVLQKYNYPVFGTGPSARTLTAAATASAPLGFPNNYQAGAEGVFSVARPGSAGLWTITLQDNYQRVLSVHGNMSCASGVNTNIIAVSENTSVTNLASANGSIIGVKLLTSSNTPADPTADASTVIRIMLMLQDSTEP
jgi:hypothetical protein